MHNKFAIGSKVVATYKKNVLDCKIVGIGTYDYVQSANGPFTNTENDGKPIYILRVIKCLQGDKDWYESNQVTLTCNESELEGTNELLYYVDQE